MVIDDLKTGETVAAIGAGLIGAAYFFRNALTRFQREATEGEKSAAEQQIVIQLRTELDRLAGQNNQLAERLNQLQTSSVDLHDEIVAMRRENADLRAEIGTLRTENNGLRAEVIRLRDEITRLRELPDSGLGELR